MTPKSEKYCRHFLLQSFIQPLHENANLNSIMCGGTLGERLAKGFGLFPTASHIKAKTWKGWRFCTQSQQNRKGFAVLWTMPGKIQRVRTFGHSLGKTTKGMYFCAQPRSNSERCEFLCANVTKHRRGDLIDMFFQATES